MFMESFIRLIAQDLIAHYGTNLRDITIVFPNKRAGLFMNQQLAAAADRPVWAPRYRTISELFDDLSEFTRCDDIAAVCELYNVYAKHVPDPEPLDRFYGWGEIMLADFDDADKHLADTGKLFSNIRSIKELEHDNYLTEEQEEALKRVFEGFSVENNSRLKEKFLRIWERMDNIHAEYNRALRKKGLLYEGALYRDVIEHIDERFDRIRADMTFVFVGFNVLNEVEKKLFHYLQEKGRARFYWDYDVMYVHRHAHFEAGTFIRQNLKDFPNALPEDCYDNLTEGKQIEMIATNSENAQARYIPQWLDTALTEPEQDTAIVLCNEALLQPVLHSLPDSTSAHPVKYANVTMGFPMSDTPIYGFVNALLNLQTDGYDRDRHGFRTEYEHIVRNHPYTALLPDEEVFRPHTQNTSLLAYIRRLLELLAARFGQDGNGDEDIYRQLYHEALYRTHNVVCRFIQMTDDGTLQVQPATLRRLMRNVLGNTTIPFHGEPASGLQVMGLLETRNLNFRHILMLSVNEGMLPKTANDTSFIPYHIRKAFGLTTIQHKIAVYAFYFYRLLQRTERITFMYNTATDGMNKGEMSRFLRQILAETDLPVTTLTLQSGQDVPATETLTAEKTPEVLDIMRKSYQSGSPASRPLSPSALNTYIDCPLMFYYQQVARIRKPQDFQNGIDGAIFGTIFHDAAEAVYDRLTQRNPVIRQQDIDRLLEQGEAGLQPFVEASFLKNYFDGQADTVFYDGQLMIARKVVMTYLRQLLEHDRRTGEIRLVSMEQEYKHCVEVQSGEQKILIDVGGKIDRMDTVMMTDETTGEQVETLRIIDYKTGGSPEKASTMEQLILPSDRRPHYIFQTFLYAWVMTRKQKRPVCPALFFVHKSNSEDYDAVVEFNRERVTDFKKYGDDFQKILQQVLNELFDPQIPFRQTANEKRCEYCDYRLLCGK